MVVNKVIKICTFVLFLKSVRCNVTKEASSLVYKIHSIGLPVEECIYNALSTKTNAELQEFKEEYNKISSTDLTNDCFTLLREGFRAVILDMLLPKREYYARKLYEAMAGLGTDENTISEIMGPMNRTEILEVSSVYRTLYGTSLRDDLKSETSGTYQHLLASLCDALRPDDDTEVKSKTAALDAYTLSNSMSNKMSSEMETDFINIMTSRSFRQLKIIFEEFKKETKQDIRNILKKKNYEDVYFGLSVIAESVYSKPGFFADQFEKSMKGLGTDDEQLTRLVVGRSEIDLPKIRKTYAKIYKMSLVDRIKDDTSGRFCQLLCDLVNR